MRVRFVLHDRITRDGGGGGTTLSLGHEFERRGHQVTYEGFERLPDGLPNQAKTLLWPTYLAGRLRSELRAGRSDVIDASAGDLWLFQRLFGKRRPVTVARSHGLYHLAHRVHLEEAREGRLRLSWRYPLYYGGFRLWEVAESFRSADLALFLNPDERDFAVSRLGVLPHRTRLVSNGVPERFLEAPMSLAKTGGTMGIAQIGTWRHMKGIDQTVAALGAILAKHRTARASLLGTGVGEAEVIGRFPPPVRHRIRVHARFRHSDLPELLSDHQISILPTLAEGFGLGLLESMACGLAAVATDTPGPRVFVSSANGVLVPPGDAPALEEALDGLMKDVDRLRRLQQAARDTALQFTWPRVAEQTLAIYEEALEEKQRGRRD